MKYFVLLFVKCNGVYEAVCECKWYELEPRQARNLLPIMIQASKPLYLTAGKLFPMTMSTFCSVRIVHNLMHAMTDTNHVLPRGILID